MFKVLLFFGIAIQAVFEIYFNIRFLKIIKKRHLQVWQDLGSPTLIYNSSIRNKMEVYKYIMKKRYFETKDPDLIRVSNMIRYLNYIFYISISLLIFAHIIDIEI